MRAALVFHSCARARARSNGLMTVRASASASNSRGSFVFAGHVQAFRGVFDGVLAFGCGMIPEMRAAERDLGQRVVKLRRLAAGEHARDEIDIFDGAREETDRIAALGGEFHAAAADDVVGRLVADDAAERCGPKHRTAGLRAEGDMDHAVGDGGSGAARRTAGRACGIVRVARDVRRQAGELAGDGLAEDHRAGSAHERDAGRIRRRAVVAIDRRAHIGRHVVRVEDVLHADGETVERASNFRAVAIARLTEGQFGIEKGPGLHRVLARGDAIETRARDGFGGERALANAADDLAGGEFVGRGRGHYDLAAAPADSPAILPNTEPEVRPVPPG